MEPVPVATRSEPARSITRAWNGRWQRPGGVAQLPAFLEVLEARGIPTTVIRMPANFPPSGTATRELSGMGTPDLQGGYGTFTIYTSQPYAAEQAPPGGAAYSVAFRDGLLEAALEGPGNPFLKSGEKLRAPFTARRDTAGRHVLLTVGDSERLLKVGEWSDWIPVTFGMVPTQSLHGQVRFFLKSLNPFLSSTPVQSTSILWSRRCRSRIPALRGGAGGRDRPFLHARHAGGYQCAQGGVLSEAEFLAQAGSPATRPASVPLCPRSLHRRLVVLLLRQHRPGLAHDVRRAIRGIPLRCEHDSPTPRWSRRSTKASMGWYAKRSIGWARTICWW